MRTHAIGTGPFRLKAFRVDEAMVLERNPNYWRFDEYGNRPPFLDAIRFTFLQDKNMEMDQFLKGPPERYSGDTSRNGG
ncbi:MAG: hypothetical protein IPH53_22920 [Flavobacteriales bacterium]|nr:hypothetical protein [Flavobacteriales bacterium]